MIAFTGLDERIRPAAEATVAYAARLGVPVEVTSTRRYEDAQRKLYTAYQAGRSRYPVAPPGQSAHQYGVAWDSTVPPQYQDLWNAIRRAMGWSVPSNDLIHAEVPGWRSYVSGLRYS